MKVSIITPTYDREEFLRGLHTLLSNQTHGDWEWLIYDTSTHPQHFSDPRIDYYHSYEILSIGEKRNRLVQKATGDVIVQCDDDDYYAPTYLEFILEKLQKVSFFSLHSWFSYDLKTAQTYYWATDEELPTQYIVNAISGSRVREIDLGPHLENQKKKINYKGRTGYGFSFAYRKEIVRQCSFPDSDFGEDRRFYEALEGAGFSTAMESDRQGRTIHVIHDTNTSSEYPQYRIPRFLVESLFPEFFTYISQYHAY